MKCKTTYKNKNLNMSLLYSRAIVFVRDVSSSIHVCFAFT